MDQIKYKAPKRQGYNSEINPKNEPRDRDDLPAPKHEETPHAIPHFPKTFNKDHIRSSDWRFLLILSLSFLVHAFFIYYLFKHLPNGNDEEFIVKIQNQYVNRFLSDNREEFAREQTFTNELLTSVSEWAQEISEDTSDPAEAVENLADVKTGDRTSQPKTSGFESREMDRQSAKDARKRNLDDMRDEVQSIGLLGIINSGSGLISTEIVQDILSHADTAAMNIKEKLAKVTSLRVPRPGVDYFGQGLAGDGEVYLKSRKTRSTRTTVPGVNPSDFVANLTKPTQHRVEENARFEEISNTNVAYAGLRTRPKKKHARRTAERIKETVLGHNPAIQDCYRLELKTNPDLRGKVTVRITISPVGHVTYAEIVTSTMNLPGLEYCLIEKIRRWNDFGEVDDVQGHITFRHTYVFGD